jgi:hypothetical protein
MHARKALLVATAWFASLVGATMWAQGGARREAPGTELGRPDGPIITGENIGFQRVAVHPSRDGKIVGKFMVKIDGQWFETTTAMTVVR